ncbi:MAG: permease-like cell division protein FtsX [Gammaproteobacteria bacterium]
MRNRPGLTARLSRWFQLHISNCGDAAREMLAQPLASMLTVAVIGIALALPASLNLLVQNGRHLAGDWESAKDFSIYTNPGSDISVAEDLQNELSGSALIDTATLIPADQAIEEFRESSGLGDVLDTLENNPLPHTLVIRPSETATLNELTDFAEELKTREYIDIIKLDTEWVQRLNAILDFLRRIVVIASLLLIIAVIIIVGNTIRLDIQNRRDEIEVLKLLGASDGFVRRPFLYIGLWYGLAGGLFALFLLLLSGLLLSAPLERLMGFYAAGTDLMGMNFTTMLVVVTGGVLSGWGGAWSAVARHLAAIQPK